MHGYGVFYFENVKITKNKLKRKKEKKLLKRILTYKLFLRIIKKNKNQSQNK